MPEPFNLAQTAFSSGEISPRMLGRADTDPYRFGCKLLRNAIVGRYGSAAKRWGSRFVEQKPTSGDDSNVRLIPFEIAGDGSYMLEFSNDLIRVYKDEALTGDTMTTPYAHYEVGALQFAQTSDSLFITSYRNPPHKIRKTASGWVFESLLGDDSPQIRPRNKNVVIRVSQDAGGPGPSTDQDLNHGSTDIYNKYTYVLQASDRIFEPFDAEGLGRIWMVGGNWYIARRYVSPTKIRADKLSITDDDSVFGSFGDPTGTAEFIEKQGEVDFQDIDGIANWTGPFVPQSMQSVSYDTPSGQGEFNEGDTFSLEGGPQPAAGTNITTVKGMIVEFDADGPTARDEEWRLTGTPGVGASVGAGIHGLSPDVGRLGYVFDDSNDTTRVVLINGGIGKRRDPNVPYQEPTFSSVRFWILDDRATADKGVGLAIHEDLAGGTGRLCTTSTDTETENGEFYDGMEGGLIHVNGGKLLITSVLSSTMVDFNIIEETQHKNTISTDWSLGWSEWSGYPTCVEIHQNRLCFAGIRTEPDFIYISKTGRYDQFELGAVGNDALAVKIAGGGNKILWLRSATDLLIGTDDQEYALKGSPLSPTRLGIDRNSNYGSSGVQPLNLGPRVLFASDNGHELRAIEYVRDLDRYNASSLTSVSDHLFIGSPVVDIAYSRNREQLIFAALENGDLLCLGYRPDQGILAWSKWEGLNVESLAVHNVDGVDKVWLSLREGYIVVLDPDAVTDAQVSGTTGLSHLEGQSVQVSVNGTFIGTEVVNNSQVTSRTGTVVAGLPIEFRFQPVEIEPGGQEQGDSQARDRTYSEVNYLVHESFGGEVLLDDGNTTQVVGRAKTDPSVHESGWKEINVNEDYLPVLVHDTPHKFEVLATTQSVEIGNT